MKAEKKNGCCTSFALALGRGIFALALVAFWQVGHAARSADFGRVPMSQNGKTTTIYPMGATPNANGSTIPVTPTIGGWTAAGNYGFPTSAVGPTAGVNYRGQFADGGSPTGQAMKYPFEAKSTVPWGTVAGAIGTMGCSLVSGGLAALACAAAVPAVMGWLGASGARLDPTTGQLQRKTPDGVEWYAGSSPQCHGPDPKAVAECAALAETGGVSAEPCYAIDGGNTWRCPGVWAGVLQPGSTVPGTWLPASMDDIAPYMDAPSSGNVIGEILSQGGTIPLGTPTVTGPSSIKGPESTTNNPDGSRTVTSTTNNYVTNGNTITNTTNTTTTTTYNNDNSVRNVTTTTTAPTEEAEKTDRCKEFPERVGCVELGEVPEGKIPKETKNVTFAPESVWGGGSCPSDKTWSSQTLGQSYVLIPWGEVCGWAGAMRAVVLVLAAWAAFWIVMPGNTQVKPQ